MEIISMKKIISCLLTSFFITSLVACQSPDTLNRIQLSENDNFVDSTAVLNPADISDISNGKAVLKNMDSGVLVNTLSGGKIDDKTDIQKLSLSFAENQSPVKNSIFKGL